MEKGIAIFDLSDTLIDTSAVWKTALSSLLSELNIAFKDLNSPIYNETDAVRIMDSLLDYHRVPFTHTELTIKLGRFALADFEKDAALMPGAIEGVKAMHSKGYYVVAIANTNLALSELAKKKFTKELQIDKWYNTRSLGVSKGDKRLYDIIAEAFGLDRNQCILIDNSEPVIKTVSKLGIKTVCVSEKSIREADYNISSLYELGFKAHKNIPTKRFMFTENLLF